MQNNNRVKAPLKTIIKQTNRVNPNLNQSDQEKTMVEANNEFKIFKIIDNKILNQHMQLAINNNNSILLERVLHITNRSKITSEAKLEQIMKM